MVGKIVPVANRVGLAKIFLNCMHINLWKNFYIFKGYFYPLSTRISTVPAKSHTDMWFIRFNAL